MLANDPATDVAAFLSLVSKPPRYSHAILMTFPLHAGHLKGYKDLAALLIKYGRTDIFFRAALEKYLDERHRAEKVSPKAEKLPKDESGGDRHIRKSS
jgi:hypothetical protein